ncbi:hypothetical protein PN499_09770 [Kamptonema animale CS-326]|jgi:hypothetical protein|nr:hypothetical protein [Kamptonema animale]MDB9511468.1 hypothetical protein [Kamptonema animale CS-326]
MPETIAITKAITKLNEAQEKFNIIQVNNPQFFTEWLNDIKSA